MHFFPLSHCCCCCWFVCLAARKAKNALLTFGCGHQILSRVCLLNCAHTVLIAFNFFSLDSSWQDQGSTLLNEVNFDENKLVNRETRLCVYSSFSLFIFVGISSMVESLTVCIIDVNGIFRPWISWILIFSHRCEIKCALIWFRFWYTSIMVHCTYR